MSEKTLRTFVVGFCDAKTGAPRRAKVEAEDYGEPLAAAVEALGGDPETIGSVWEE